MSTVIAHTDSPVAATVLASMLPVSLTQPTTGIALQITYHDFHLNLSAPLIDLISEIDSSTITIKAIADTNVSIVLTLAGKRVEGGTKFWPEHVSMQMDLIEESTRSHFVASTLRGMLGLTKIDLQIPDIGLNLKLSFDLPLQEISQMLQRRQIFYRLMVIERATNKQFVIPPNFSGEDIGIITFIYRAIVDRSFAWPVDSVQVPVPATREWLDQLAPSDQPTHYEFESPEPVSKTLLGQLTQLGHEVMTIDDGIIQSADEVRRELARDDGHPVEVIIRPLSGQVRHELPEAPRLPDAPWDSNIQRLINLESQLDARLAERYHALAAATLADLTEEEKKVVTARPELDEDAFLLDDSNGEKG